MGIYNEHRGRPRGKFNAYGDLNSMVLIASKHDLDPFRLVDALFEAMENKISHCGSLKITNREVNRDSATFLIEKDEKVVWQYPINLDSIRNPDLLKKYIQDIPIPLKKEIYQKKQQIAGLRFGMKGIDIHAKIIEIPQRKIVHTRWGTLSTVSNVKIADETGSMRLSLWNKQIDKVHVGDEVEIENCRVSRFAGQLQLRLGRKGTLSVINQPQQEELIQYSSLR